MNRTTIIGVVLAATLAGCGGEDDTVPLSQAQLEQALLTEADLPEGYQRGTGAPDDDSSSESDGHECDARWEELDAAAVAKAEASFEASELGPLLEQTLTSFEDEGLISDHMDGVTTLLSECATLTTAYPEETKSPVSVRRSPFPKLGDETVAVAVHAGTALPMTFSVVMVRVGSTLQTVFQFGLAGDPAGLEQAARRGTEKLQAAS